MMQKALDRRDERKPAGERTVRDPRPCGERESSSCRHQRWRKTRKGRGLKELRAGPVGDDRQKDQRTKNPSISSYDKVRRNHRI